MKTPEKIAHLLIQGMLEQSAWPELEDEEVFQEVQERLRGVGLSVVSADGFWVARGHDGEIEEGFVPIFELNEAELAVLAALYLHLRYLPRERGATNTEASVSVEDIERGFPAYKVQYVRGLIGRLRNMHFVRQLNERLYAGPYLSALDEVIADERAAEALRDFKLRRYLKRRLAKAREEVDAAD